MEPHERRSVYIGSSHITGGGEGIFARRSFSPGELVSYFNGVRVTEEMMFWDNMTKVGNKIEAFYISLNVYVLFNSFG